ncbi:hypothetical protein FOA52_009936 [Chlamydomonas sp. UWO 241]|nr:hypothetical protein FOA52_009936 [Chlamydomonas sp. UWO 241]
MRAAVAYSRLHDGLSVWGLQQDAEPAALLLYALLHTCAGFRDHVLCRTDAETLLLPLLRCAYDTPPSARGHAYMLQILLLILSQDESVMQAIQRTPIPPGAAAWYTQHPLVGIGAAPCSLGSLLVMVLVRCVLAGLASAPPAAGAAEGSGDAQQAQAQQAFLPTNALAALANTSAFVVGIHAHAASRLLHLFQALGRRQSKLSARVAGGLPSNAQQADAESDLAVVEDFMQVVLESLCAPLGPSTPRNPELMYVMLQRQELLQPYAGHARFGAAVAFLQAHVDFFNQRLAAVRARLGPESEETWEAPQVLQEVSAASLFWHPEPRAGHELRFAYEEERHSEDFFMPYVWSLLLPRVPLAWEAGAVRLCAP